MTWVGTTAGASGVRLNETTNGVIHEARTGLMIINVMGNNKVVAKNWTDYCLGQ